MKPLKQAIIFCGGTGVKLRPLTFSLPKPLLPIINKPILDYVIFSLKNAGVSHVIIVADYLAKSIEEYIQQNNFGISIEVYILKQYFGTAQILVSLKEKLEDTFLVVPGDCLYDFSLKEAIDVFQKRQVSMGLFARKETDILGRGGLVLDDQNYLKEIVPLEENSRQMLSDAFIYFMKKDILSFVPKDKFFEIHLDLIRAVLDQKQAPFVIQMDRFWAIIGRIHPYLAANFWILQNIRSDSYIGNNTKISKLARLIPPYFIDEDCVIEDDAQIGPNAIIGKAVHIGKKVNLDNTIIHANTSIGRGSTLCHSLVSFHCSIDKKCSIGRLSIIAAYCKLGHNCFIEDGARIGPNIQLKPFSKVSDFIFPMQYQDKHHDMPTSKFGLNAHELEICLKLQESGEQTFGGIKADLDISEKTLRKILNSLIAKKIVLKYGKNPVIYSLISHL